MINYIKCPSEHMVNGLKLYIEKGIKPGSFLQAVLANDFTKAATQADFTNIELLREWAIFMLNEMPTSIITFADLRFGDGSVYSKCGFEFVEFTNSNYWYSKKYSSELFSRVKFQKHKLAAMLETFDPLKTEFENMVDNDWDRIWDCGNAKFTWVEK